jgi:hypothetical protein
MVREERSHYKHNGKDEADDGNWTRGSPGTYCGHMTFLK